MELGKVVETARPRQGQEIELDKVISIARRRRVPYKTEHCRRQCGFSRPSPGPEGGAGGGFLLRWGQMGRGFQWESQSRQKPLTKFKWEF